MREIPPNFQRGHHQQPSFGCAGCAGRESQLGENLLDSPPTDMPQEIPRVFSQRSLLSFLGQSFSPDHPPSLSRSCPFPLLLSFYLQPVPSRPFSKPLSDIAFPDLFRLYGSFKAEIPPDCQSFIEATAYPAESRSPRLSAFDGLI